MRQMMEGVVLNGTGRRAVLQGYTSGGKTGSAQIYDPKTGVYTHTYNASFLGFAPVGNPRVVVAVTLHATKGGSAGFGGARAAPVFREVAMTALRMLDVPKDLPDVVPVSKNKKEESDLSAVGSDDGAVAVTAARMAKAEGAPNDITQDGDALRARAVSSVTSPLVREDTSPSNQRPFLSVPNFHGMTVRAVAEESTAAGVRVEFIGEGLASNQDPPAGANLRPGMAVKVQFKR
jgi:cell division protein FtsI (penicillin-binding protein 3)